MNFLKKLNRRFEMAKRFKAGKKEHIKTEVEKEEEKIAEKVAEEKTEEDEKMKFLEAKGLQARPNSHMAIKAWEEYKAK